MDKLFVANIEHYPKNGEHLEIIGLCDFPFEVTKGLDTFYFTDKNGTEHKSTSYLWYCDFMPDLNIDTKGFKTPQKAIEYGFRQYKKWLNQQLKKLKNFNFSIEDNNEIL